jgi:hypothetical protein
MIKITTLFKKDPTNLARVINEINPENEWVFKGEGIATRKFDGTAAAIINGEVYKRYDVKKGRQVPEGAIPCQEPDAITGHWPHWVKCDRDNKEDKYFFEGLDNLDTLEDSTYELCGPKVQGNPEGLSQHTLVKHGAEEINLLPLTFDGLKEFFTYKDIEGIVFHHPDGRMCKIRKSDFGIKRQSATEARKEWLDRAY